VCVVCLCYDHGLRVYGTPVARLRTWDSSTLGTRRKWGHAMNHCWREPEHSDVCACVCVCVCVRICICSRLRIVPKIRGFMSIDAGLPLLRSQRVSFKPSFTKELPQLCRMLRRDGNAELEIYLRVFDPRKRLSLLCLLRLKMFWQNSFHKIIWDFSSRYYS